MAKSINRNQGVRPQFSRCWAHVCVCLCADKSSETRSVPANTHLSSVIK